MLAYDMLMHVAGVNKNWSKQNYER